MAKNKEIILKRALFELSRRSYLDYVEQVHYYKYFHMKHTRYITERLQQIAEGEQKYLIVELPPRHSKSQTITETFPSYYLGLNPRNRVIATAYSDGLARKFGRLNRNKLKEFGQDIFGVGLSEDNSNVNNWTLDNGVGGMISTGIGGSITGEGADCVVGSSIIKTDIGDIRIDDLHKTKCKPLVLTYNHKTKEVEYKKIQATREIETKEIVKIKTFNGIEITSTKDHEHYEYNEGYKSACSFNVGDDLSIYNAVKQIKSEEIKEIEIEERQEYVYDIQVADNHNFFANGVLVHNCLIIDDPIKNNEEAQSQIMRDKVWDEWETTLSTRLHKGASVIVVMTRWHEDDLVGRLLERSPYDWERIRMPAVAEDTDDLLGREIGQTLAPELGYDEQWAALKKKEVGSKTWLSLYQQRPTDSEGNIFNRSWWQFYDMPPQFFDEQVISWDLTFKDNKDNDYVVGQVWGRRRSDYYLIDQVRDQMDFPNTVAAVRNLSQRYPMARTKLIEDKANGPAVISTLKKEIAGIVPVNPKGGKISRAQAVTPFVESGNVYLPKHKEFSYDLIEEAAAFPNGKHDKELSWVNLVNCWEPLRA